MVCGWCWAEDAVVFGGSCLRSQQISISLFWDCCVFSPSSKHENLQKMLEESHFLSLERPTSLSFLYFLVLLLLSCFVSLLVLLSSSTFLFCVCCSSSPSLLVRETSRRVAGIAVWECDVLVSDRSAGDTGPSKTEQIRRRILRVRSVIYICILHVYRNLMYLRRSIKNDR